jgi:glycolate oxidase iron-sulfur subunit
LATIDPARQQDHAAPNTRSHGSTEAPPPQRGFDAQKPPPMDLIDDCVHCGFCLPTCPTYVLWGEEMDSPRGRIVLMKAANEPGSELTATMVNHWDNCLGCMSCVTACPSGVQYDKLIEDTRAQVERNHRRTPREWLLRRGLFATFPHPGRLRALAAPLVLYKRSGLAKLVARSRLLERVPTLRTFEQLAPDVGFDAVTGRLPAVTPARGERRARVGFLQGCVQRVLFHGVNRATVDVLAAEGFEVHAPRLPRCCGALGLHAGEQAQAIQLAVETIKAFEPFDHVVVNAAGCGSTLKDYGHLLRDFPEWHERAEAFSAKALDVTELLSEYEPVAERGPVPMKVAYHDACHLAHAQGVRAQPRRLLRGVPELELVEPEDWELCCGSAGIYNLVRPEAADELGRRKADNLLATGAEAIAAGNPGCTLQITAHLERRGRPLPVLHPVEILELSIRRAADERRPHGHEG